MEIPASDFSKEELLALEKETLGLYVSSHPLRDIRDQIRREAGQLISQLGELPDGTVTTIIGMISTVKRITTKRSGEMMAFVTVEGMEGQVEMLCFPALFQEHRELLVEDKVVKIKGLREPVHVLNGGLVCQGAVELLGNDHIHAVRT